MNKPALFASWLLFLLCGPAIAQDQYGEEPLFGEQAERIIVEGEVLGVSSGADGGFSVLVVYEDRVFYCLVAQVDLGLLDMVCFASPPPA